MTFEEIRNGNFSMRKDVADLSQLSEQELEDVKRSWTEQDWYDYYNRGQKVYEDEEFWQAVETDIDEIFGFEDVN